jgi:hypothetical protein
MSGNLIDLFAVTQRGDYAHASIGDYKLHLVDVSVSEDAALQIAARVVPAADLSCRFDRVRIARSAWDTFSRIPMTKLVIVSGNILEAPPSMFFDAAAAGADFQGYPQVNSDDAALIFTTIERNNPALRELRMHNALLTGYAAPFPPFTSIRTLDLSYCFLRPEGIGHIARSLGSVTDLYVNNNYFSDAGAIAIAENMKNLLVLHVGRCRMGGRGVTAICAAAARSRLKELRFSNNLFGEDGAAAGIADLLRRTNHLFILEIMDGDLDNSRFSPAARASIIAAAARSTVYDIIMDVQTMEQRRILDEARASVEARIGALAFFAASVVRPAPAPATAKRQRTMTYAPTAGDFLRRVGDRSFEDRLAGLIGAAPLTQRELAINELAALEALNEQMLDLFPDDERPRYTVLLRARTAPQRAAIINRLSAADQRGLE